MDIIDIIWGAILIIFGGLLCWLAQVINASSPTLATKLGLNDLLWLFFHTDRSLFSTSLPKREFDAQWVLQVVAYRQQRNHVAYLSHRKRRLALLTQLE